MEESSRGDEIPGTSANGEDAVRSCRNKKKLIEPTYCPVCSVTLRSSEIESHLVSEIDKLYKLSNTKHKVNGKNCNPSASSVNGVVENRNKHWETYQKVQSNRQSRQRIKSRKRKHEIICPICNKETSEDITVHVEACLRRTENNSADSDENIDVEGGYEEYEEYEWAGQSRVRVTSLLPGGVSSLGTPLTMTDEDEDLVVDGDDSQMYGYPQYSECDIIIPGGDKEQVALRQAVIGVDAKTQEIKVMDVQDDANITNGDPTLEALKSRIHELESREQSRDEVYKCLICMERYKTPVISVCCWHVHCEQCWLQTLGAKKLCPQCNMITSPADLRRIYM